MRDIPIFSTEFGVASLSLKEIPYNQTAHITIQDAVQPDRFIDECISFCKAVGAQRILARGNDYLVRFPIHSVIWRMSLAMEDLPATDALVFPLTAQLLEKWREIYNSRMQNVTNAAYMSLLDAKELLSKGCAYFVHRGGILLGVGIASGEVVDAVISVVPGSGKDVLLALCSTLDGSKVTLDVSSDNLRAIALYEKMGFIKTAEVSRWYQIV